MTRTIEINNVAGWKMAQACMAKKDIRPAINYLCIDLDANTVAGTDGYKMVHVEQAFAPTELSGRYLVQPQRALPKSAISATLDLDNRTLSVRLRRGKESEILCEFGDKYENAMYPDLDPILTIARSPASENLPYMCFNPKLVSEICTAGEQEACLISPTAKAGLLLIQFPAGVLDDVTAVVMATNSEGFRGAE